MRIGRADVIWNYAATFLKIAASGLLLPFILRMMSSETVGIWTIFMTISSFVGLLDFGFNPSFSRNITYVFSGVRALKTIGFDIVDKEDNFVDYGLLKGVIVAMRWFYLRVAVVMFLLLITLGTYYIRTLLKSYNGDKSEVLLAWALLCVINTFSLFTLYYESLLIGKGLVKRSKQIIITGQTVYLIIASTLIIAGYGLVAIVSAQASSVIIIRLLSYRSFYSKELKRALNATIPRAQKETLHAIYPNAVKVGLTLLGGFMVSRSAIVIGSLFLTLGEIASFGITMQLIGIIVALAGIYTNTYLPKIAQLRVEHNNPAIKDLYLKGQVFLFSTFIVAGGCLFFGGQSILLKIGSHTKLLPQSILIIYLLISLLESNHSTASTILLSKNEVPFFKASLLSGGLTVILLLIIFIFSKIRLWAMILAPGIAQGVYQNWKWPLVVAKEFQITSKDLKNATYAIITKMFHLFASHEHKHN